MVSYTSHILLSLFRSVKCTISVSKKTIQQVEGPLQDENIEPGSWEWGDRGHVLLICPQSNTIKGTIIVCSVRSVSSFVRSSFVPPQLQIRGIRGGGSCMLGVDSMEGKSNPFPKKYCCQKYFHQKYYRQKYFHQKYFSKKNFLKKKFHPKYFHPKYFHQKYFLLKIFSPKIFSKEKNH